MYQTMTLEQLETCSTKELKAYKTKAQARKNELEALKAKGGDTWTNNLQEELNDIVVYLVDIDDALQGQKKNVYKPAAGTENLVHVKMVRGRRFNPRTGKEESKPYVQMFTFSEWLLFKINYKGLGYEIEEILYNPYKEEEI